jgi:tRNA pseudouridine55 synthase
MVNQHFILGNYKFSEGETLFINKPMHWTSFDVVNKIRYCITKKAGVKKLKVGHAGTLDPLADGLLIVNTGKMTKNIEAIQALTKEYTGAIFLGATRPSYDKETEIDHFFPTQHIAASDIMGVRDSFLGVQEQLPPIYSAIKKDGNRLYKAARRGTEVKLESRRIEIFDFEILRIEPPRVYFRILCSKGTYIRSIASDFGKKLNSGAFLDQLTRTKIGDYKIEDAMDLTTFVSEIEQSTLSYYDQQ